MTQSKQAEYPPCDCERRVIMMGGPAGALWPHEERCTRRKAIVAARKPAPKPAAPRAHRITPHCAPGCVDIEAQKPAAFECWTCADTQYPGEVWPIRLPSKWAQQRHRSLGHDVREVGK